MFNRVQFVLSKRISQNKSYFNNGKRKLNNIKKIGREFSTSVQPSPNGGDNFLVVVLMGGIVFVANSRGPPPSEVPHYFDWISI